METQKWEESEMRRSQKKEDLLRKKVDKSRNAEFFWLQRVET